MWLAQWRGTPFPAQVGLSQSGQAQECGSCLLGSGGCSGVHPVTHPVASFCWDDVMWQRRGSGWVATLHVEGPGVGTRKTWSLHFSAIDRGALVWGFAALSVHVLTPPPNSLVVRDPNRDRMRNQNSPVCRAGGGLAAEKNGPDSWAFLVDPVASESSESIYTNSAKPSD